MLCICFPATDFHSCGGNANQYFMTIYVLVACIKQDNAPSDGHYRKINFLKMIQDPITKLYFEMIMPDCMFSFFNYE